MATLNDETFRRITELMYGAVGLSFADGKKPLVSSRLAPRIQRLGLDSYEDYLALIDGPEDGGEFQVAVDLLTTNETYFFREPAHYALLEAELSATKPRALSVWSAASSFGDEAYSTAMLLADLQQQGRIGSDWRILGTDISDRVLRSATEAIYPLERLRMGCALSNRGRRMALAAIRRRHPNADDTEVRLRYLELAFGPAVAAEVRRWLGERRP